MVEAEISELKKLNYVTAIIIRNITTLRKAAAGIVMIHERPIFFNTLKSMEPAPFTNPTPTTPPTAQCEVDMGRPNFEHINTDVAAPKVAANPRDGVILVILRPMVSITLYPHV